MTLNVAFDTYREMYFEGGVSSVYLWDLDEQPGSGGKEMNFAGAVLIKKSQSFRTTAAADFERASAPGQVLTPGSTGWGCC